MINFADIKIYLTRDEDHAKLLKEDIKLIIKSETRLISAYEQFYQNLAKISNSENIDSMQSIFSEASQTFQDMIETQEKYKNLLNAKVDPSIQAFEFQVKNLQKDLDRLVKLDEAEQKKRKETRQRNVPQKVLDDYNALEKDLRTQNRQFAKDLKSYFIERNLEYQAIMQHIANKLMVHHAEALSKLTVLAENIIKNNVEQEAKNLFESLIKILDQDIKKK